jgi:hypothetical protein
MWLLPFLGVLFAATPPPPSKGVTLPPAIRATLNQEYPGWKLAPVTPQIQKTFQKHRASRLPSLTYGDFDHDGKRDYAVQIVLTTPGEEEQIVIVFLARGEGYEENILESMGLDPSVYLWVGNKALTETGPNAQDKLVNKDVLMVLGNPVSETTYVFDEGKFQEIKSQEDPDHPDASIPRAPAPAL